MRGRYRVSLVALAFLLLSAVQASAVLSPLEYRGAIEAEGPMRALYHAGQEDVAAILTAPSVEVTIYERDGTVAHVPMTPGSVFYAPVRPSNPSTFQNPAVTIEGGGRIGWYAATDDIAKANGTKLSALSMLHPRIGEHDASSASQPSFAYYAHESNEPGLVTGAEGQVLVDGSGTLWVHGPTLTITSDEGTTTYATGEEWITSNVVRETWAVLRAPKSHLQFAASSETQVVFSKLAGSAVNGESRVDFTMTPSLLADGEPVVVASTVKLAPAPAGVWNAPAWVMDPRVGLALVGAVVAVGVGAAILRRRPVRVVAGPASVVLVVNPEDVRTLEDRAEEKADAGEFAAAAHLYAQARAEDPANPTLPLAEGMCHLELGHLREALAAFLAAADLDEDGEAERWAAHCYVRLGDDSAARSILKQGLRKRPGLALLDQIETEREFGLLLADPHVSLALDDARDRAERAQL